MSNLKLPNMSFASLDRKYDARRTIAYATEVQKGHDVFSGDYFKVFHHGNQIASIAPNRLWLSNGGWNSSTTANRLHKIAVDTMGLQYAIGIRDGLIQAMPWAHCGRSKADRDSWAYVGSDGVEFTLYADNVWLRVWSE